MPMDETTLTICVSSLEEVKSSMKTAFRGRADSTHRHSFPTAEAMARTITPARWNILEALTGAGPVGVRELARRLGRDVKDVHRDATALLLGGLVEKTKARKILFPYERVKVSFELHAKKAA